MTLWCGEAVCVQAVVWCVNSKAVVLRLTSEAVVWCVASEAVVLCVASEDVVWCPVCPYLQIEIVLFRQHQPLALNPGVGPGWPPPHHHTYPPFQNASTITLTLNPSSTSREGCVYRGRVGDSGRNG